MKYIAALIFFNCLIGLSYLLQLFVDRPCLLKLFIKSYIRWRQKPNLAPKHFLRQKLVWRQNIVGANKLLVPNKLNTKKQLLAQAS